MDLFYQVQLFLIAALLGGLVGLERQYGRSDSGGGLLGVRTFAMISLLGAASALIADTKLPWFPIIAFCGVAFIVLARYIMEARHGDLGITTELTELFVFIIGALVYWQHIQIAVMLAIGVTLILSIKSELDTVAKRLSDEDVNAIIKFAIITFVVLPILKDQTIDPWGYFNPREVWFMVVLISAVSFAGYFIMKFAKVKGALELTGIFGGLVSSTAVALSFSQKSKEAPNLSSHLALGVVLAEMIMFPRLLLLIALTGRGLLDKLLVPFGAMMAVGLAFATYQWFKLSRTKGKQEEEPNFTNPFEITTAIKFGAIYAVIRVGAALAIKHYGQIGLYSASLLSGLVDTDAITLSVARMIHDANGALGGIDAVVGAKAVTIAAAANTAFKAFLAISIGAPAMKKQVALAFGAIIVAGVAALFFI